MELGVVDFRACRKFTVGSEVSFSVGFSLLIPVPAIWITRSQDFQLFFGRLSSFLNVGRQLAVMLSSDYY